MGHGNAVMLLDDLDRMNDLNDLRMVVVFINIFGRIDNGLGRTVRAMLHVLQFLLCTGLDDSIRRLGRMDLYVCPVPLGNRIFILHAEQGCLSRSSCRSSLLYSADLRADRLCLFYDSNDVADGFGGLVERRLLIRR